MIPRFPIAYYPRDITTFDLAPGPFGKKSGKGWDWDEIAMGRFSLNPSPLDLAPQHNLWCIYVPNPLCQARVTTAEAVFLYSGLAAVSSTYE